MMQNTCVKKRGAPAKSVLLALATLLAALAICLTGGGLFSEKAFAITTDDGWEYELKNSSDNKEIWITDYKGSGTEVKLPSEIDKVPVVSADIQRGHTLKSLDCSEAKTLKYLTVQTGGLETLKVTDCTALENLACSNNKLKELDISSCKALTYLDCSRNYLDDIESLKVWLEDKHAGFVAPQYNSQTGFAVEFYDQEAIIVGWDKRTAEVVLPDEINGCRVVEAWLDHCGIKTIDISACKSLRTLHCDYNYITDLLDINKWAAVDGHELFAIPQFDDATGFAYEIRNGEFGEGAYITDYDNTRPHDSIKVPRQIKGQPILSIAAQGINCGERGVLDLSECTDLIELYCTYGDIDSIYVGGLTNLASLNCDNNRASKLQVSGCSNLQILHCNENSLSELDLTSCSILRELNCWNNNLTSLNLDNCPNLESLNCSNNQLSVDSYYELYSSMKATGKQCIITPQRTGEKKFEFLIECYVLEEHANQNIFVGAEYDFGCSTDVTENPLWLKEDAEERNDISRWSVFSVDEDDVVNVSLKGPAHLYLQAKKAGQTHVTIEYEYQGKYGYYHAKRAFPITIAESVNPVTSITLDNQSVDLFHASECPICKKTHNGWVEVPYTVETRDPNKPPTDFGIRAGLFEGAEFVKVYSSDPPLPEGEVTFLSNAVGNGEVKVLAQSFDPRDKYECETSVSVDVRDATNLSFVPVSETKEITIDDVAPLVEVVKDEALFSLDAYSQAAYDQVFSRFHNVDSFITEVKTDSSAIEIQGSQDTGWKVRARIYGKSTITIKDVNGNYYSCEVVVPSAPYKVECYFQDLDGEYKHDKAYDQYRQGTPNTTASTVLEGVPGFNIEEFELPVIAPDGSTVVKVQYSRNNYKITWNANGGKLDGGAAESETFPYGAPIDKDHLPTASGKEDSEFAGWESVPATMPAENITINAQWAKVEKTEVEGINIASHGTLGDNSGVSLTDDSKKAAVEAASGVLSDIVDSEDKDLSNVIDGDIDEVKNVIGEDPAKVSTVVLVTAEDKLENEVGQDASIINDQMQQGKDSVAAFLDIKVSLIVRNESSGAETKVGLKEIKTPLMFESRFNVQAVGDKEIRIAYVHENIFGYISSSLVWIDRSQGIVKFPASKYSTYAIVTSEKPAPPAPSGGGSAPAQKFQVTFESNGGSAVAAQEVESGATVTKPADPTREGYTFAGWFSDEELTQAWDFAAEKVTAKTTLYAKWTTQSIMFSDVDFNAWYGPAITFVADSGLMRGYAGTDLFGVGKNLTRAELAVILCRHANPDGDAGYDDVMASTPNNTGMTDVEAGVWYTGAANWAVANGVINGKENADGTRSFDPNGNVTFEEMVAMMVNLAATPDEIAAADMTALDKFVDAATISDWSRESLAWAAQAGIFNGYDESDGTYIRPLEQITRERAAAVLFNNYA